MDRIKFIKTSVAMCFSGVTGASMFLESCQKSKKSTTPQGPSVNFTLDLTQSSNAALNTSGGSVASHSVVIINSGGSFIALAETCTHQGCNVYYSKSNNLLMCPCHGANFNMNGDVTAGPAPSPLKKYFNYFGLK